MTLNPNATTPETRLDEAQRERAEAAAFRTLVAHLQQRTDVQNIDMMNLAGFCRNCLSRWYAEAAAREGVELDKMEAREIIHGMPFEEWKAKHQTEATDAQRAEFATSHAAHGDAAEAHSPRGAGGDAGGIPTS